MKKLLSDILDLVAVLLTFVLTIISWIAMGIIAICTFMFFTS